MEISQTEYDLLRRTERTSFSFTGLLISVGCLLVLAGVGYAQWPAIKAAYYADVKPAQAAPAAPADTSEADRLKAANARLEAQLRAAQAAAQQAPVIAQSVPQGQAAPLKEPVVNVAPIAPVEGQAAPEPAPAPIVIVLHEGGGAPRVTGSGACAVAAKGARRCGK